MVIEVNLYASLWKYRKDGLKSGPLQIEVETEISVSDLLARMGVPEAEVKLVFRNGIHARRDEKLCDGDRLGVFPPIGGG